MLILQATFYAFLAIVTIGAVFIFGFKIGAEYAIKEAQKMFEAHLSEKQSGLHIKKSSFQEKLAQRLREAEQRKNSNNN